jgi:outer membrane protein OmpA-like peptidoglycan-associated protein
VAIEGFTDSTGSEERNQVLSEQRANAVREALLEMGISPGRITTRGYGKSLPVASNATEAGRQLNRRVEILLSDENGQLMAR